MPLNAHAALAELKATGRLPSPSGVALAIMELCQQESAAVEQIAHAVRADPALAGRIIKFANAAVHGPRRPVVSIADAIRMVGVSTVRQVVLGFSLLGQYRTGACKPFDYSRYWARSLAMAIAAQMLCMRVRSVAPDEGFTCGLLATVGTLALATLYPDEFGQLLTEQRHIGGVALARLERQRFAADHAELSAALMEDWHLPRLFVTAALHHEQLEDAQLPEGSREYTVCGLLNLAAQLADFCVAHEQNRKALIPDLILAAARLGVDEAGLGTLSDELVPTWTDWGRILQVTTEDVLPFEQILEQKEAPPPALELVPPSPDKPFQPLSILVVDDDRSILMVLEHLLRGLGHRVTAAQDGKSALAKAVSLRPQIIISDWIMPGLDGVTLCKALRETEEGQQMYFIILSALEQDDQLIEAFESGVDDYLTKPFTPRVLAARLRAGQRVIRLQDESRRDSEHMRRVATELAVANRRLQQAALTDPLTGLPNRRYAMERLEQEWSASSRSRRPVSYLLIDIDHFKQVNDAHGQEVGDMVLRQVAALLRKVARAEDVICRVGGEEFSVIANDTPASAATQLAERLRSAVERAPLGSSAVSVALTVSLGVAARRDEMQRIDELTRAAEGALQDAKRAGCNRVSAATPPAAASGQGRP
jgi:diguanylate cyclase (GGDEF)-like protein